MFAVVMVVCPVCGSHYATLLEDKPKSPRQIAESCPDKDKHEEGE